MITQSDLEKVSIVKKEGKGIKEKQMRNTTFKMSILLHGIYRLNIPDENIHSKHSLKFIQTSMNLSSK